MYMAIIISLHVIEIQLGDLGYFLGGTIFSLPPSAEVEIDGDSSELHQVKRAAGNLAALVNPSPLVAHHIKLVFGAGGVGDVA